MTQGLFTPSDIAEMAGVSRGAVSNWRSSNRQFPQPVSGSEARPLFDVAEVTAWLTLHDYKIRRDRGERMVWSLMNQFRGHWSIETTTDFLLNVLTARRLAADSATLQSVWNEALNADPLDAVGQLRRLGDVAGQEHIGWVDLVVLPPELAQLETSSGRSSAWVFELLHKVNQLAVEDLETVADYALERMTAAQARSAGLHGLVGSRVAVLLASLVPSGPNRVVYDPACGIAESVIRAHKVQSRDLRIVGQDINLRAVQLARQRCVLSNIAAEITVADVLKTDPNPSLRADVVLVEPPFGLHWNVDQALADPRWVFGLPPKSSADMAWMQHAIYHLADGGRAYVVTSAGSMFRQAERDIRTQLLRQGCIETIISLPGKMVPYTSIPLVLWVLCRPGDSKHRDTVLLIDASKVTEPETHIHDWLRQDPLLSSSDRPLHAHIEIKELLAGDSDVQPQRWVGHHQADLAVISTRHQSAVRALSDSATQLESILALSFDIPDDLATPRVITLKDLGALVQGRMQRGETEELASLLVTPRDVKNGLTQLDEFTTLPRPASDDLAKHETTQPGDILITTMNEVRTTVDQTGGHILGNGVYRLRVDPVQIDPAYVAFCLTGSWNDKYQMGTTIKRANINLLEVPLLPLQDQQRITELLQTASAAREQAAAAQNAATEIITGLLDLVRYQV